MTPQPQTTLFPQVTHIPQWLADYFALANAGSYPEKQLFYNQVKPTVLKTFGEFAGYDLQIIERKCWSCDGTGVYKHYHYEDGERYLTKAEPCFKCNKGIYMTNKVSLERYALNGVVYHIPCESRVFEPIKNEIRGIIEHAKVDNDAARRAFIILLWRYKKAAFYDLVKALVNSEIKCKTKYVRDLIQSLFRKDNLNDDLPF